MRKRNPLIIKEARAPRYNDCGYVVVKRSGALRRVPNQKVPLDHDKLKDADQNLGTHDKKGKFIKKRRYKMWQNNPVTPGRGVG
jgi:hypothetical protein